MSTHFIQNLLQVIERSRAVVEGIQLEIEDEDLLDRLNGNQHHYGLHDNQPVDLETLGDDTCLLLFRLTLDQIKQIKVAIGLADEIVFRGNDARHSFKRDAIYSLAILLRRLFYPSRLKDLTLLFGYDFFTVSTIINGILDLLDHLFRDSLDFNEHQFRVYNLQRLNAAITEKNSSFVDIVGFIDGTCNAICRPSDNQEVCYNGHKRNHCLKYKGVVTPDGITSSLLGSYPGAMHDQRMLKESGLLDKLEEHFDQRPSGGKLYALYGDAAYGRHECFVKPITNRSRSRRIDAAIRVNQQMSRLRVAVEWEFGHTSTLFAHVHFQPKLKLQQNRVGPTYRMATFFKNIHTRPQLKSTLEAV
ncbi:hypothetical protein A0J61_11100 [Choanephora cucurbitarum]|uniref:DDE Tnp4 domain-containing protein n=1 Tax=Choanephora cucurbitarum TaxID=101091 RepID=A0A1C7MVF1_9FUNG|nr:hypothetical protein A0J61_11100 [Choanephora cucurbitarum]